MVFISVMCAFTLLNHSASCSATSKRSVAYSPHQIFEGLCFLEHWEKERGLPILIIISRFPKESIFLIHFVAAAVEFNMGFLEFI